MSKNTFNWLVGTMLGFIAGKYISIAIYFAGIFVMAGHNISGMKTPFFYVLISFIGSILIGTVMWGLFNGFLLIFFSTIALISGSVSGIMSIYTVLFLLATYLSDITLGMPIIPIPFWIG